jgi:hypothetical protein
MKALRVGAGSSGEVSMAEQRNPRLPRLPVMLALLVICSTNAAGVAGDDPDGEPPAVARKVVVLVHGLKQDDGDLQKLSDFLARDKTVSVLRAAYDSDDDRVEEATEKLIAFVQKEAPKSEVHFVGFSLGNLVIRQYLQVIRKRKLGLKTGRVVMIAPPNHGALIAVKYKGGILGRLYAGPVFKQLGTGFAELEPSLDTPKDFGIIAGGKGDGRGFSQKTLPGDDDDYLRVETTRLSGAADFRLAKLKHEELDDHPLVHKLTLKFLQAGFFESHATRRPIR